MPSNTQALPDHGGITDVDSLIQPLEFVGTADSEPSSRYRQVLSLSSRSGTLVDSSFPPLPVFPVSSQQNPHPDARPKKTMAAHLRHHSSKKGNASSSASSWPAGNRTPSQPVDSSESWPSISAVSGLASSSGQSRSIPESVPVSSSCSTSAQIHPPSVAASLFAGSLMLYRASGSTYRPSHSSSAPRLSERESFGSSGTDFPPVSAVQTHQPIQALGKVENVQVANKSLVEKMRVALGFDEEKFTAFKEMSGEYRQGSMDAEAYLECVIQFGLSHLVFEMARLLPNVQKQKELIDACNLHMAYKASILNGSSNGIRDGNISKKSKGKSVDTGNGAVKNNLADNVISTVRELQTNFKASDEDIEVLSKDGYRGAKGKPKVNLLVESSGPGESTKSKGQSESLSGGGGANQNPVNGGKQRKKTSKFPPW